MYEDMQFYFLCKRSASVVHKFIGEENLHGSWVEYEFPSLPDKPEKVFPDTVKLINFLLEAPAEEYGRYEYIVYLEKKVNDDGGMYIIAFCRDGNIVFGIPPLRRSPEDLGKYAEKYDAIYGFISSAHPETSSMEEIMVPGIPTLYKGKKIEVVGHIEDFEDAENGLTFSKKETGFWKRLLGKEKN